MSGRPVSSVVGLLLLAAANGATSPQGPSAALTLQATTRARSLQPGEVVLVIVTPSRPLAALEGRAFDVVSRFWPSDTVNEWQGLVGIPLSAPPTAAHNLALRAKAVDGQNATQLVRFTVAPGRFPPRRLTVDPRFVNPPASTADRIAREAQAVADVFAHSASGRLWRGAFDVPVPGAATSSFGRMSVINGVARSRHQGTDFRASEGTSVVAPNAGRVVLVADHYFSGNTVIVDHGDQLFSVFAHLSRTAVTVGAPVERGDALGAAGATGRVTGPHLHWAVRLHGTSVDPLSLVYALAR